MSALGVDSVGGVPGARRGVPGTRGVGLKLGARVRLRRKRALRQRLALERGRTLAQLHVLEAPLHRELLVDRRRGGHAELALPRRRKPLGARRRGGAPPELNLRQRLFARCGGGVGRLGARARTREAALPRRQVRTRAGSVVRDHRLHGGDEALDADGPGAHRARRAHVRHHLAQARLARFIVAAAGLPARASPRAARRRSRRGRDAPRCLPASPPPKPPPQTRACCTRSRRRASAPRWARALGFDVGEAREIRTAQVHRSGVPGVERGEHGAELASLQRAHQPLRLGAGLGGERGFAQPVLVARG